MENDLFLTKIESSDEILEGNAVDSFVYYTTAYSNSSLKIRHA